MPTFAKNIKIANGEFEDLSGNSSFLYLYVMYDILFSILVHISYSEDFPIIVISRQLSSPSIERDVAMHLKC